MWQFYYVCEYLLSDITKLSDQQYRVFPSRHIFDPAMLSLAFLDVLTGLIATPIVTLVYYYSRESEFCSKTKSTYFSFSSQDEGGGCRDKMRDFITHLSQVAFNLFQVLVCLLESLPCLLVGWMHKAKRQLEK